MKKILLLILALSLLLPCLLACGESPEKETTSQEETTMKEEESTKYSSADVLAQNSIKNFLTTYANNAYDDIINHWWQESKAGNGVLETGAGNSILWEYAMALLGFETYYLATGNEDAKDKIADHMKNYCKNHAKSWLLGMGGDNNPACDDASWTSMAFMLAYRMTEDDYYLDMAHECIEKTYESFGAGTPEQGLWYNLFTGYPGSKSLYCAGTILSALEYYDITKGTEKEDAELQEQTMGLYNWVETNLRRDHAMTYNGFTFTEMDYLYYNDFMVNSATIQAPNYFGQGRTTIGTGGSSSSFFGNTAMCVINKRLYELTGDEAYLDKALKTANAFVGSNYDLDGVLCNDRDAYTNCAFVGFFVREVLSLDGITDETKQLFLNTAKSILNNCYFEEGYYGSDWAGENKWTPSVTHGNPHCLTNNATTVHMIYAVCWAVQNGVILPTYSDLSGFPHGEPLTEHPYPNYQE